MHFLKNENQRFKRNSFRFDGFMLSLSKDKKLTWFMEIYIAKKVQKVHVKFKRENGQITIK